MNMSEERLAQDASSGDAQVVSVTGPFFIVDPVMCEKPEYSPPSSSKTNLLAPAGCGTVPIFVAFDPEAPTIIVKQATVTKTTSRIDRERIGLPPPREL